MTESPNRTAKSWSNAAKEAWRQKRRALIGAVRAWANSDCGAKEADALLAALARLDDAAGEATKARHGVRKAKKGST